MMSTSLLRLSRCQHAGVFAAAITTVLKPAWHEIPRLPSRGFEDRAAVHIGSGGTVVRWWAWVRRDAVLTVVDELEYPEHEPRPQDVPDPEPLGLLEGRPCAWVKVHICCARSGQSTVPAISKGGACSIAQGSLSGGRAGWRPCNPKMMIGTSMAQLMPMMMSVPSRTDSSRRPSVVWSWQLLGFEMMKRMPMIMNHVTCDATPAIASTGRKSELICHLHPTCMRPIVSALCG